MSAIGYDVRVIVRIFGVLLAIVFDDHQAGDLRHRPGEIDLAFLVRLFPEPSDLRTFHADYSQTCIRVCENRDVLAQLIIQFSK